MSETNEVTVAPAVYKVIDGFLYVDGIKVQHWQITPDQLKRFFPEKYQQEFGRFEDSCFLCDAQLSDTNDKRVWMSHIRFKHPEFNEQHQQLMRAAKNYNEFKEFVKAQEVKDASESG